MLAADEVTCAELSPTEWALLHQVEIALETMADYQRVLEGECYVTGSMVVVAAYQIRKARVDVICSSSSEDPVRGLRQALPPSQ